MTLSKLSKFFPVQCCLKPLGQHCIELFLCNVVQGVLRQHFTGFFFYPMLSGASQTTLNRVLICAVVSRVLRQHWTGFFLLQYCTKHFGQSCIGFWLVQGCSKNIKAKLHKTFSYAMLSGVSWTTLYRDFTCAVFFPRVLKIKVNRIFSYAMLSKASRTTLLMNMIFSTIASRTTLHSVLTCVMLPQEY